MRDVRTAKPDDGEKGLLLLGLLANELQRLAHDRVRAIARGLFGLAVVPKGPVRLEVIRHGKRFIESNTAWRQRIGVRHHPPRSRSGPAQMPFAKMRRRVTGLFGDLTNSHFLFAQRHAGPEDPHAVRMPPGQHAGPRGRATLLRVKAVAAQPRRRHRVDVWRLDFCEAVVTHIAPALVIRHAEDDVRFRRLRRPRRGRRAKCEHGQRAERQSEE